MNAKKTVATFRAAGAAALIVVGGGCGGKGNPPKAVQERPAYVAQPCRRLELGSDPVDPANARTFVEVAEVSTRGLPQPVGRWLEQNAVKVRATANLVAFPNVPTSTPWGPCVDAVCSSTKLSIAITARLPERASEPMDLALRIEELTPEDPEAAPRALLDTTLRAVNQEPVVLPPAPEVSDGSLVVTAYLLRRHDDLQRLLECKQAQKEAEQKLSE